MFARLAPLPPARRTSLHASSKNQSTRALLFIDDSYRSYRCSRHTNPLNRKNRQLETMRRKLIQVGQVFDVPVVLVHHDQVRLPEMLLLEHGPDRRIKCDGIGAHHAHTLRDQVACGLGSHTTMIGKIAFLGIVGRCSRLNEEDIALLECVAYFLEGLFDIGDKDTRAEWLVAKVKHDPIRVAVLEGNTFRAWSLRASNMFNGITMRSNMVARDVKIGCREPLRTVCGCADTLGKFSPALIHEHRRRLYLWEGQHITMHWHR